MSQNSNHNVGKGPFVYKHPDDLTIESLKKLITEYNNK